MRLSVLFGRNARDVLLTLKEWESRKAGVGSGAAYLGPQILSSTMANTTSLPDAFVSTYWSEVKAALLADGMKPTEADGAIRDYRAYVEPAKWTVYNDAPEEVAEELRAWLLRKAPMPAPDTTRSESGM